jgi:hypothetical protein
MLFTSSLFRENIFNNRLDSCINFIVIFRKEEAQKFLHLHSCRFLEKPEIIVFVEYEEANEV